MPFHWCGEETAMLLAALGPLGFALRWTWVHGRQFLKTHFPRLFASHSCPCGHTGGEKHF